MSITVSIEEDDRQTRESLVTLLRRAPGVRILGVHASGELALSGVPLEKPDVVLMDINLPGMNGVECVGRLKAQMPALCVLMLTTYEDSHLISDSLRAGASGYILKSKSPAELLNAKERAASTEMQSRRRV